MLASDFQSKLRKINTALRIFCGNDDSKPAGLFHVVNGEYVEICAVDKNWLPEHPIVDEQGRYIKVGWRRPLRILIGKKLVDRRRAEQVFGTQIIGVRTPSVARQYQDPIQKEIEATYVRNFAKTGSPAMKKDEIMDLAKAIEKQEQ